MSAIPFIMVAVISLLFGLIIGYGMGRRNGWMIGEELERRKWKRRQSGSE